jgi:hypothetical protein
LDLALSERRIDRNWGAKRMDALNPTGKNREVDRSGLMPDRKGGIVGREE